MKFILEKLLGPTLQVFGEKLAIVVHKTSASKLHNKIFKIFKAHEIKTTQIPIIVPDEFKFNIDDIDDRKSFQLKITKEFLAWIIQTFNINPEWLHDDTAPVYQELCVYKGAIRRYVDLLIAKQKEDNFLKLVIIKTTGKLTERSELKIMLVENCEINGIEFERNTLFSDTWLWYDGGGWQLRLMIMMGFMMNLGCVRGRSVSNLAWYDLSRGRVFISELKFNSSGNWNPNYCALCLEDEHKVIEDTEGISEIIEWGKGKQLIEYFESKTGLSICDNPLIKN